MKRGFIRGLWGIHTQETEIMERRYKIDNDIKIVGLNKIEMPFVTYVFGTKNYDYLVKRGFECKLVDKEPLLWDHSDRKIHYYGYKLKVLVEAMKDYDEIVFLDWDCLLAKPLPQDFWEVLGRKSSIQAILRAYKKRKYGLREKDKRKRPCASFIYLRDKKIADQMYNYWLENKQMAEEQVMAKTMDDLMGGWKGVDKYWELFEPDFFVLGKNAVPFNCFSLDLLKTKNRCFIHLGRNEVIPLLVRIKRKETAKKQEIIGQVLIGRLNGLRI